MGRSRRPAARVPGLAADAQAAVRASGLVTCRDVLTRAAFLNAIKVNTAIGGSTNAPPHLQAIARHAGVELSIEDWQAHGYDVPLLTNVQPSGKYLCEAFHRAGGVPAVMGELMQAGLLDGACMTVSGKTVGANLDGWGTRDEEVGRDVWRELVVGAGAPLRWALFAHVRRGIVSRVEQRVVTEVQVCSTEV